MSDKASISLESYGHHEVHEHIHFNKYSKLKNFIENIAFNMGKRLKYVLGHCTRREWKCSNCSYMIIMQSHGGCTKNKLQDISKDAWYISTVSKGHEEKCKSEHKATG